MKEVIDGTLVPFAELRDVTDWSSIKKVCVILFFLNPFDRYSPHFSSLKYHKLNGEAAIKGSSSSKEREIIDNIVVSSVAMKSVMWIHIKKILDLCWIKKFTRTSMAGLARILRSILLVQLKTVGYDRGANDMVSSYAYAILSPWIFFRGYFFFFRGEKFFSACVRGGPTKRFSPCIFIMKVRKFNSCEVKRDLETCQARSHQLCW